jgi:hypothetical protein
MEYRIELGGLVLTGEAGPMDIAALARELAAMNVREVPSHLALAAAEKPEPRPEPTPAPQPAPEPQPRPLGNGHGAPTAIVEHTMPEAVYRAVIQLAPAAADLPTTSRNAGPGRQYVFTLDSITAVVLYECLNYAIDAGAAKGVPSVYHQRLRLRKVLDEHFHLDVEEAAHG